MSLIEFENVSKKFGHFIACNNISLKIEASEVHAIVGENGAGKSTLVKLLGGIESSNEGQIFLNQKNYDPKSAQDAFDNKIAFIHQHFVLAENLSAIDNIVLYATSNRFPLSGKRTQEVETQANAFLAKFSWKIDLKKLVSELSVGEQQRLEILKSLLQNPDIIIFDEPTAVLSPLESEELLKFILELKAEGKTILLISHKLSEIKAVADKITILRQGSLVKTVQNQDVSTDEIAELMIGQKTLVHSKKRPSLASKLFSIPGTKVEVQKGEIFGVAGIEGNGQSQLISKLLAHFRFEKLKFGDISEDRLHFSIFKEFSLKEHLLIRHPDFFRKGFFIDQRKLKLSAAEIIKKWDVRPTEDEKPLSQFSGGNQQKFVVGRELFHDPDILLAAHPTRGVDLGSQASIHNSFKEFAGNEKSVLLVSSDLDEVLQLSHRFVVLNKNKIFGPFLPNELSEKEIGTFMAGELLELPAAKWAGDI